MDIKFNEKIEKVLAQYHQRMEAESLLMQSLPLEEGMKRRNEFLLSVGVETAIFLNSLIKSAKPPLILEIGTSYGYSTIWLAEAAQSFGGKVISLENDSVKASYAREMLENAGLTNIVEIIEGDALTFLEKTKLNFDFVLLDIWKELYMPCFDLFFPKLNKGAWVISDNMIFPPHSKPEMDIYRNHLHQKDTFDSILLPIGSGIEISKLRF